MVGSGGGGVVYNSIYNSVKDVDCERLLIRHQIVSFR